MCPIRPIGARIITRTLQRHILKVVLLYYSPQRLDIVVDAYETARLEPRPEKLESSGLKPIPFLVSFFNSTNYCCRHAKHGLHKCQFSIKVVKLIVTANTEG